MFGEHRFLTLACALVLCGCGVGAGSPLPAVSPTPTPTAPLATPTAPVALPSPPAPPPSAAPTELAEATSPSDVGVGLSWSLAHKGVGTGTGIAMGPAGWMYVAMPSGGGGPVMPELRLSQDLRTWDELLPDDPRVVAGADWTLAASRSGYVMAAGDVWRSADGRHWVHATAVNGDTVAADRVASDGSGFVAWRAYPYPPVNGLWVSTDGLAWARCTLPGAPALIVDALIARPSGGYVLAGRVGESATALGYVENPTGPPEPLPGAQAVWTSEDGINWTIVPLGVGFASARIRSIAAGGPGGGIVAVGSPTPFVEGADIEPLVAVWRWTVAAGWQRVLSEAFPEFEGDMGQTRIIATEARWLLVGSRTYSDAGPVVGDFVIAGSEDGAAWWSADKVVRETSESGYFLDVMAAASDRLVFLVNDYGPGVEESHVQVWYSPSIGDG